ncbi:hypothetical protein [Rheinheimera sp.]|uniref:hypothetical protein n=1 Tax=Rheinheimera sp. TaxID=1869214 RepID=UPI00307F0B1C
MKPFYLCFFLLLLSGCSTTYYQERLQQPMPLPEGEWTMTRLHPNDLDLVTEMRWQDKNSQDLVQSFVFEQQPNVNLQETKRIDDEQGQLNCDLLFDSQILSQTQQQGYPQLTWVSECKSKTGQYSKVLHKAIAGKESLYVFNRIWRTQPLQTEWDLWLAYSNRIYVCDQRVATGCQ